MGKILTTFLSIIALACLVACNNDGCVDNGSSLPLAAFYTTGTTTQATVSNLSVYGIGAPGDSALVSKTATQQMYLPLRATAATTRFLLNYNDSTVLNDTITINYKSIPYFVSADCGAMYNFKITSFSYTTHKIDSIAIPDSMITNVNVVAIRIFVPKSST